MDPSNIVNFFHLVKCAVFEHSKPVLVLNAIEEEKLLIEGASKAEAYAEMALNTASA